MHRLPEATLRSAVAMPDRVYEAIGVESLVAARNAIATRHLGNALHLLEKFERPDLTEAAEAHYVEQWHWNRDGSIELLEEFTPTMLARIDRTVFRTRWLGLIRRGSDRPLAILKTLPEALADAIRPEDVARAARYQGEPEMRTQSRGTASLPEPGSAAAGRGGEPGGRGGPDSRGEPGSHGEPNAGGKAGAHAVRDPSGAEDASRLAHHAVAAPWTLAEVPERYVSEALAEVALDSFRAWFAPTNDQGALGTPSDAALRAVGEMSPRLRSRITPRMVADAWRDLTRGPLSNDRVRLMLLLDELPDDLLAEISPEEVREVWEQAERPRNPERPGRTLRALGLIPGRLRSWVDDARVRAVYERLSSDPTGMDAIDALCQLPGEMRRALPADAVERVLAFSSERAISGWLHQMLLRIAGHPGEAPKGAEHLGCALAAYAWKCRSAAEAFRFFAESRPELAPYVSREEVLTLWRLWVRRGMGPDVRTALVWAGVPGLGLTLPQGPLGESSEAYRPEDVRAELARAMLEELAHKPEEGWRLPSRLPNEYKPALRPEQVQAVWRELVDSGRFRDALSLLELAPGPLRPAPDRTDLPVLLGSEDAEVRLAAIRLAAAVLPDATAYGALGPSDAPDALDARLPAREAERAERKTRGAAAPS
jgi:hypothetical protein